jgi:hypothetical protein
MRDKGTKENLLKKMRPRRFRLFKLICVCSLVIFHKGDLQDFRKNFIRHPLIPLGAWASPNLFLNGLCFLPS